VRTANTTQGIWLRSGGHGTDFKVLMPKIFQLDNLWAVFFFLLSLSLFTRLISTIDIDLRLLLVLRISLNFLSFSFFFWLMMVNGPFYPHQSVFKLNEINLLLKSIRLRCGKEYCVSPFKFLRGSSSTGKNR